MDSLILGWLFQLPAIALITFAGMRASIKWHAEEVKSIAAWFLQSFKFVLNIYSYFGSDLLLEVSP